MNCRVGASAIWQPERLPNNSASALLYEPSAASVFAQLALRSRLDVYEYICDAGVTSLDRGLYSMRDLVALMYGNVSVHANV